MVLYWRVSRDMGWLKKKRRAVVVQIVSYVPEDGSVRRSLRGPADTNGVGEGAVEEIGDLWEFPRR